MNGVIAKRYGKLKLNLESYKVQETMKVVIPYKFEWIEPGRAAERYDDEWAEWEREPAAQVPVQAVVRAVPIQDHCGCT